MSRSGLQRAHERQLCCEVESMLIQVGVKYECAYSTEQAWVPFSPDDTTSRLMIVTAATQEISLGG